MQSYDFRLLYGFKVKATSLPWEESDNTWGDGSHEWWATENGIQLSTDMRIHFHMMRELEDTCPFCVLCESEYDDEVYVCAQNPAVFEHGEPLSQVIEAANDEKAEAFSRFAEKHFPNERPMWWLIPHFEV